MKIRKNKLYFFCNFFRFRHRQRQFPYFFFCNEMMSSCTDVSVSERRILYISFNALFSCQTYERTEKKKKTKEQMKINRNREKTATKITFTLEWKLVMCFSLFVSRLFIVWVVILYSMTRRKVTKVFFPILRWPNKKHKSNSFLVLRNDFVCFCFHFPIDLLRSAGSDSH